MTNSKAHTPENNVIRSFQLPAEDYDRIVAIAKGEQRTFSQEMRWLVAQRIRDSAVKAAA